MTIKKTNSNRRESAAQTDRCRAEVDPLRPAVPRPGLRADRNYIPVERFSQ